MYQQSKLLSIYNYLLLPKSELFLVTELMNP